MNSNRMMAAVLAALIGVSGVASAQDRGDRDNRDNRDNRRDQPAHEARDNRDKGDNRRVDYSPERRNDRQDYHHDDRRDNDRGAGPRHDLRKGGRLPAEYRNRQYVVENWRDHHLNAPPRGYHWVQTGGDYVLVAITTGIIASLILNN
ncbi:hypothetical protein GJ699_27110 [Duganella sp. FT80W]|uniref:RcnB family protein n=1 Tax=Duganella guangzhouensis TaxID=2666084 RepID=A0A6I2LBM6_9BURK|nr:RcnB family protein [Duganella guangzhouensis]MRW93669.1 hypothetical protein [Duganella guangzhouensis]